MRKLTTLTLVITAAAVFAEPPLKATPLIAPAAKEQTAANGKSGRENKRSHRATHKVTEATASQASATKTIPATPIKPAPAKADLVKKEQEALAAKNALAAEREKLATAKLREELTLLKLEKERLAEQLAIADLKRKTSQSNIILEHETEKEHLMQKALIAKAKADKMSNELKAQQLEWQAKTAKIEAEMKAIEIAEKRAGYADSKPVYLESPLKKDGTLVISDRRITMNGPVTSRTADHVTSRINYYNNKNPKQPIFIVIDDSPGGSVMSGYRILKSMEGSSAPVYVVVKSFAASMAAIITTLAEKSYAYPNAVILHHQMSMTMFGRLTLTKQKELYEESQKWWVRLAKPISDKMGISTDEFIKQMYKRSSDGDWSEFADVAQELKWVDHVVERIHETALVRDPDAKPTPSTSTAAHGLTEDLSDEGGPVMYLPRTNPRDFYFLYNPDNYYQLR